MASNEWTIQSPLFIQKNRKGDKWYLNQNNYRNTHFHALNQYKKKYKSLVQSQIDKLPSFKKVSVTLCVYARDKRLFDLDNVAAVHLKFFLDALTESGKLPDDDYTFVPEIHTYFGSIDRTNPRVEITVKELSMKIDVIKRVNIEVTQDDLEEMIKAKIAEHDANIRVKSLTFVQRRNPSRTDVEVEAYYGDDMPVEESKEESVVKEDQPDLPIMEDTEKEEDTSEPETVGDIFAGAE